MEWIPAGHSDLIISSCSISQSGSTSTEWIQVDVTVENQGNRPSPPSRVHLYLSTDQTISTDDEELASMAIGEVDPGGTQSTTSRIDANRITASNWIGACVDPVAGEENRENNCSEAVQIVNPGGRNQEKRNILSLLLSGVLSARQGRK